MRELKSFLREDSGAVTIDWVALSAGILLLGVAVVYAIFESGVVGVVDDVNTELAALDLSSLDTDLDAFGGGDGESGGEEEEEGQSNDEGPPLPDTPFEPSFACQSNGNCVFDTDGDGLVDAIGGPSGPTQATGPTGTGSGHHGQSLADSAAGAGVPVKPISALGL
ncbi:hypothetical protein LNKW23_09580 [Paralimibaculum aggregatum]|uniref:Uncharacterized protein n=1 Tax=Paralimibaculum aggregatum TaxID=3036245 RepID=A0ABQ6LNA0_9RHOB|nr:hypothetical protein [Limibaculum sp. NKW23]GMG81745.1 hypothetical protein LNKW23_09580 [Limibaculum sp. NKW23]